MKLHLCVDAKRSRPSIGQPVMGHARKERVLLFGTDQRITSGPAATAAASRWRQASKRENRPYTWLHPNASQTVRFLLHRGRRPYMAHRVISRQRSNRSLWGARATVREEQFIALNLCTRARYSDTESISVGSSSGVRENRSWQISRSF